MSASIYDPATKTLVPFAGTSISMMSELSDVELSAPSNGQVLRYDSSNQAWENADNVSDVSVTPVLSSGTKIATVTVDGSSTDLYAPSGGGGGGGGHTIEDAEGTALTQRDTLQFGEGLLATDDSTNAKTIVSPDVMQSGDMDDVITPLPSVSNKMSVLFDESGAERVVGWYKYANGTKKPVYEKEIIKTYDNNFPTGSGISMELTGVPANDFAEIVSIYAWLKSGGTIDFYNINHPTGSSGAYKVEQYPYISGIANPSIYYPNIGTKYTSSNDAGIIKIMITVRYVKTSDTAE